MSGTLIIQSPGKPDQIVSSTPETTLFAACGEQGILLPTACGGRGLCGKCRVQTLSGAHSTPTPAEEKHISADDFAKGWRLACQTRIGEELRMELPADILAIRRHTGVLEEKTKLTYDIVRLTLRLEADIPFSFTPGQYIQLESPAAKPPLNQPTLRAYSLSSIPGALPRIELVIRHVPNGISSTWVHEKLQPGDPIAIRGPFGDFHLRDSDAPIIAIAGSSGMSPFRAIFPQMEKDGIQRESKFFFGARTQPDLFLLDEWAAFEKRNPWFHFIPVLSHEPEESGWTGERGLVTDAVSRHCPHLATAEAYLCGSPGMLDAAIAVLTQKGLPEGRIFFDKFTS